MKNKNKFLLLFIIASFIFSKAVFAQLADTPWPTYMASSKHTGLSQYETDIQKPALKWKFDAGNGIETGVTIASDGTLYFGAFEDNFFALNPDGTEKWRFVVEGDQFRSTPTLAEDGTIYFGAVGKLRGVYNIMHEEEMEYGIPKLYALNPDGTKKWEFELGGVMGGTTGSPTVGSDGTIYMGNGGLQDWDSENEHRFWAINPDGTVKWFFQTNEAIFTAAAIADNGTIYVACADSNLYAINPDGTEKWRFTRKTTDFSVFDGTPTVGSNGTIYAANTNNNLYAITPEGEEKWHFAVADGPFEATPTIGPDETIYFGVIDQSDKDRNVYAVTPEGKLKWKFETGGGVNGSPVIDKNGTLFFGSYDYNVYSLSSEGKELWRFPLHGGIVASPTISDDNTIYIGSWDNHLYAITDESLVGEKGSGLGYKEAEKQERTQEEIFDHIKGTVIVLVLLVLLASLVMLAIKKRKA